MLSTVLNSSVVPDYQAQKILVIPNSFQGPVSSQLNKSLKFVQLDTLFWGGMNWVCAAIWHNLGWRVLSGEFHLSQSPVGCQPKNRLPWKVFYCKPIHISILKFIKVPVSIMTWKSLWSLIYIIFSKKTNVVFGTWALETRYKMAVLLLTSVSPQANYFTSVPRFFLCVNGNKNEFYHIGLLSGSNGIICECALHEA